MSFLYYIAEHYKYKPCLKLSKMEGISSNDWATLIRLKIDSNVKIYMTQYVTWAAISLWEQSDIVSENYC